MCMPLPMPRASIPELMQELHEKGQAAKMRTRPEHYAIVVALAVAAVMAGGYGLLALVQAVRL